MMKREEADVVPMLMRWGRGDVMIQMRSIQNTMKIFGGVSVRRAVIIVVRPRWAVLAGSIGMVKMSTMMMTVCVPLCI